MSLVVAKYDRPDNSFGESSISGTVLDQQFSTFTDCGSDLAGVSFRCDRLFGF